MAVGAHTHAAGGLQGRTAVHPYNGAVHPYNGAVHPYNGAVRPYSGVEPGIERSGGALPGQPSNEAHTHAAGGL